MRNIWTIAKREYDLYFISPVAYVVAFLFLTIIGLIFTINLVAMTQPVWVCAPRPTRAL
jgi:ABC-type transport system involved in multi-copper enzyme maturation permease subunit